MVNVLNASIIISVFRMDDAATMMKIANPSIQWMAFASLATIDFGWILDLTDALLCGLIAGRLTPALVIVSHVQVSIGH